MIDLMIMAGIVALVVLCSYRAFFVSIFLLISIALVVVAIAAIIQFKILLAFGAIIGFIVSYIVCALLVQNTDERYY